MNSNDAMSNFVSEVTPIPDDSFFVLVEDGGVTTPLGFRASAVHAGFRKNPQRLDCALVSADELCSAAGAFTQNIFCAAPVSVSKKHLNSCNYANARAVIINSGNANAATGVIGLESAEKSCEIVADALGCASDDVLVASTGVIGQIMSVEPFETSIDKLVSGLDRESGTKAACAIMTTDLKPKEIAVSYTSKDPRFEGVEFHVGGMAKGSGMIMPNMATMIAVLTTDVPIDAYDLHEALLECVNESFNKVTVDSDTSTNDSVFVLASGKAAFGYEPIAGGSPAFSEFVSALKYVCQALARSMAADGEGATKLITVKVKGAKDEIQADLAARAVANSPLVKTAIFGHDANWGRIAGALGRSSADFKQEDVSIDIMGIPVCRDGLAQDFSEEEALKRFEFPEIVLEADLGAGDASTCIWTCDFSHDYITINGDYRT